MKTIQEVFNEIQELKKERKDIKKQYKDALSSAAEYDDIVVQSKKTREKKKQIETSVQQQMSSSFDRLEELDRAINELEQRISDIAMTTLMSGQTVEVKDQYDNNYEPIYKVSFKKTNTV